jgi:hypothetical protein
MEMCMMNSIQNQTLKSFIIVEIEFIRIPKREKSTGIIQGTLKREGNDSKLELGTSDECHEK